MNIHGSCKKKKDSKLNLNVKVFKCKTHPKKVVELQPTPLYDKKKIVFIFTNITPRRLQI